MSSPSSSNSSNVEDVEILGSLQYLQQWRQAGLPPLPPLTTAMTSPPGASSSGSGASSPSSSLSSSGGGNTSIRLGSGPNSGGGLRAALSTMGQPGQPASDSPSRRRNNPDLYASGYANVTEAREAAERYVIEKEERDTQQQQQQRSGYASLAAVAEALRAAESATIHTEGYANVAAVHSAMQAQSTIPPPLPSGGVLPPLPKSHADAAKEDKALRTVANVTRKRTATASARENVEEMAFSLPPPSVEYDAETTADELLQQEAARAAAAMFLAGDNPHRPTRRGTVTASAKLMVATARAQQESSVAAAPQVAPAARGAMRLQRQVEFCKTAGLSSLLNLMQSFKYARDNGISSAAMALVNAVQKDAMQPFSAEGTPRIVIHGTSTEDEDGESAGGWKVLQTLLNGQASTSGQSDVTVMAQTDAALLIAALLRSNPENAERVVSYVGIPFLQGQLRSHSDAASSATASSAVPVSINWKAVRGYLEMFAVLALASDVRADLATSGFLDILSRISGQLEHIPNNTDSRGYKLRTSRALVTALGNMMFDDYAESVDDGLIRWVVKHIGFANAELPSDQAEMVLYEQEVKLADASVICIANLANSENSAVKDKIISFGCLPALLDMLEAAVIVPEAGSNAVDSAFAPDSRKGSLVSTSKGPYESLPDPARIAALRDPDAALVIERCENLRVAASLDVQRGVTMSLAHLLISPESVSSQVPNLKRDNSATACALYALGNHHLGTFGGDVDDDVLLGVLMVFNNIVSSELAVKELLGIGSSSLAQREVGRFYVSLLKLCQRHRDPDVSREANEALAVLTFAQDQVLKASKKASAEAKASSEAKGSGKRDQQPKDASKAKKGDDEGSFFGGSFLAENDGTIRKSVQLSNLKASPLALRTMLSQQDCRELLLHLGNPSEARGVLLQLAEASKDPLNRRNLRAAGGLAASVGVLHSAAKSEHERVLCIDLLRIIKRLTLDALAAVSAASDLSVAKFNTAEQRADLARLADADMRQLDHIFSTPRGIHSRLTDLLSLQASTTFHRNKNATGVMPAQVAAADAANAARLVDNHSAEVKRKLRCLALDVISEVAGLNPKHQIGFSYALPFIVRLAGLTANGRFQGSSRSTRGGLRSSTGPDETLVGKPVEELVDHQVSRRALLALSAITEFNRKMQSAARKANAVNTCANYLDPNLPLDLIAASCSAIHALVDGDSYNQERLRKCGGVAKLAMLLRTVLNQTCLMSVVATLRATVRLSPKNQDACRKASIEGHLVPLLERLVNAQLSDALYTQDELIAQSCGLALEYVRDNPKNLESLFQAGIGKVILKVLTLPVEGTSPQVYFASLGVLFTGIRRSNKLRKWASSSGMKPLLDGLKKHPDQKVSGGATRVRAVLGK